MLKRIFYIVFVLLIISVIQFGIFKLVPGNPALMMIQGDAGRMSPEAYQKAYDRAVEILGLDKPIPIQYIRWVGNMLKGDFGFSSVNRMPVTQLIKAPMMNTVKINVINLFFAFIITIPLGISTAVRKGSLYDNSVQVVTIMGYSLPPFVVALVSICFFAVKFKWLPISGMYTPALEGTQLELFLDRAKYLVLPVAVLTFMSLGGLTRYVRAAMIDALRMDYIRTARAKGLREKVVIYSHAFRNSLIPVVTVMTSWFIAIFSGSTAIERIFAYNGMGNTLITSLMSTDYAVVLALNMFYIILALAGYLILDFVYMLVDPRVRMG